MKYLFILSLLVTAQTGICQDSPVIVELFTSQGCSSCPAADKNLKAIVENAEAEGKPVYGLSFHVDYWNYIGWKDPYSSKQFTERQKEYAKAMSLRNIYTPQFVINGAAELVGSNVSGARALIEKAARSPVKHVITITKFAYDEKEITVTYRIDKPTTDRLNIALVNNSVENYVPRGENSGRTLTHANVVVYFHRQPAKETDSITIPRKEVLKQRVVLFLSDEDGKITGAIAQNLRE